MGLLLATAIIALLLKSAVDGFSLVTAVVVIAALCLLARSHAAVITENVLTELQFSDRNMTILYRELDRHDGAGRHTEEHRISPEMLTAVRYNPESQALTLHYRRGLAPAEEILYLTDDAIREEILTCIRQFRRKMPNPGFEQTGHMQEA